MPITRRGNCWTSVRDLTRPDCMFLLGSSWRATSPLQRNGRQELETKRPLSTEATSTGIESSPRQLVVPPISTLPPPLELPERKADTSYAKHLFQTGRAYGRFYWKGLKLTWSNHKDARPIRLEYQNLHQWASSKHPDFAKLRNTSQDLVLTAMAAEALHAHGEKNKTGDVEQALSSMPAGTITVSRAEFQLLNRDEQDWRQVPKFGVLFLICGEYLPLLVPFMPGLVPRTCRIPKQIDGMRKVREDRAKESFASGIEAVPADMINKAVEEAKQQRQDKPALAAIDAYTSVDTMLVDSLVSNLDTRRLLHASTILDLHSRWWGRLGLTPPQSMLKKRVKQRLQYIAMDDRLLLRVKDATGLLSDEEVKIACDERAIAVTDKTIDDLHSALAQWVARFDQDGVVAYFKALFDQTQK